MLHKITGLCTSHKEAHAGGLRSRPRWEVAMETRQPDGGWDLGWTWDQKKDASGKIRRTCMTEVSELCCAALMSFLNFDSCAVVVQERHYSQDLLTGVLRGHHACGSHSNIRRKGTSSHP